jgi:ribosomal protein S18 acetylase RimI-like enzyme
MITVRPALPGDESAIAHLAARTFPLASPAGTGQEDIDAFIVGNLSAAHFAAHIVTPATHVIVAVRELIADDSPTSSPTSPKAVAGLDSDLAVVERDGRLEEVVGYVLLVGGDHGVPDESCGVQGSPSIYLSKFYVDAQMHGGSVSAPLMEAVRAAVQQEFSASSVWLAVNQLNVRAAKFYEKSGFQRVGTKTMQVGSRLFADYVYELTL